MREIKFRPLRRIKKTGKITVASYMQWRKVKTADYNEFKLVVDGEYKMLPSDELVYDHKGENLFWYNHTNPEGLPKWTYDEATIKKIEELFEVSSEFFSGETWKLNEPIGKGFHPSVRGFDCDGVPVFSHYSTKYLATHYQDLTPFEPLTVGMVVKWFGWFIYQLENSRLKIG